MTDKALNFTAPMAAAIWRGDKWMTRRKIKLPRNMEPMNEDHEFEIDNCFIDGKAVDWPYAILKVSGCMAAIPYRLEEGDTAVIREPWWTAAMWDKKSPAELVEMSKERIGPTPIEWGDGTTREVLRGVGHWGRLRQAKHLPFQFARMRRKVLSVRPERLGDISEAQAQAEGAMFHDGRGIGHSGWRMDYQEVYRDARHAFAAYWDKLYGEGAWTHDASSWVWVIEFERKAGA